MKMIIITHAKLICIPSPKKIEQPTEIRVKEKSVYHVYSTGRCCYCFKDSTFKKKYTLTK